MLLQYEYDRHYDFFSQQFTYTLQQCRSYQVLKKELQQMYH